MNPRLSFFPACPARRQTFRLSALALVLGCATFAGCERRDPHPTASLPAITPGSTSSHPHVVAVARGTVEIPGGLLEVTAPQDGSVESVAVQEGQAVPRGRLLLRLSSERLAQDLAMARAELDLAQARQAAQQMRLPAVRRMAQRMNQAAQAEAIDAQRADEAQQALRELEAALPVARAETAVAAQKVAEARSQMRSLSVFAAQDATVLKLFVQPGVRVSAQSDKPLLTLLPARAPRVRAELNEAFISNVAVGTRASIHVDSSTPGAAGEPSIEARVVRIDPIFGPGRLDEDAQVRGNVRVVACFLEFDRPPSLRVGQAVRVDFHE